MHENLCQAANSSPEKPNQNKKRKITEVDIDEIETQPKKSMA